MFSGPKENVVLGGAFQFNGRLPTWEPLKLDQLKLEKSKRCQYATPPGNLLDPYKSIIMQLRNKKFTWQLFGSTQINTRVTENQRIMIKKFHNTIFSRVSCYEIFCHEIFWTWDFLNLGFFELGIFWTTLLREPKSASKINESNFVDYSEYEMH